MQKLNELNYNLPLEINHLSEELDFWILHPNKKNLLLFNNHCDFIKDILRIECKYNNFICDLIATTDDPMIGSNNYPNNAVIVFNNQLYYFNINFNQIIQVPVIQSFSDRYHELCKIIYDANPALQDDVKLPPDICNYILSLIIEYTGSSLFPLKHHANVDPWIRDFIACKTLTNYYVINHEIIYTNLQIYHKMISTNNIGANIKTNHWKQNRSLEAGFIQSNKTNCLIMGGNIFHCINIHGKKYAIVGELGITATNHIEIEALTLSKLNKTIGKSINKYPINDQQISLANQRQQNKQILQLQLQDTKIIIIPNAFLFHIDTEVCVLPNGVVLLHSFEKSKEFIELQNNKQEIISNFSADTYNKILLCTEESIKNNEVLFKKQKDKLEKRGFLVRQICGFLTESNDEYAGGLIATGFNGLPIVTRDGKILYCMAENKKLPCFQKYMVDILKSSGVTYIEFIQSVDIEYFKEYQGFFRCQTNTIPIGNVAEKNAITKYNQLLQIKNLSEQKDTWKFDGLFKSRQYSMQVQDENIKIPKRNLNDCRY